MIKTIFQKLLFASGKHYQIDKNIPSKFFIKTIFVRVTMLLRGFIYCQKKAFLGSRTKLLNKRNIYLGKNSTISTRVIIDGYCKEKLIIGNNTKIGAYSEISSTSHFSKYGKGFKIGSNSGVGKFAFFGASGGIKIGNDVIMGEYVSFHSENHNFSNPKQLIREQGVSSKGILLGNNIWVGAKVTFLDGAVVGDNSVVAAGAVVKDKFPSNVVIGGVPAKIIKQIV